MRRIHTKTPAGQQEINLRSRSVPARARTLLILVDGKRTDAELAALVPDFEAGLQVLLQAGLVAATETEAAPVRSATSAGSAPASTASTAPAPPATAPAAAAPRPARDLATLRRDAARAVNDLLGPEGDALAVRIERAAEAEVLQVALERCVTYIAETRGKRAAEVFSQRFLTPPGG